MLCSQSCSLRVCLKEGGWSHAFWLGRLLLFFLGWPHCSPFFVLLFSCIPASPTLSSSRRWKYGLSAAGILMFRDHWSGLASFHPWGTRVPEKACMEPVTCKVQECCCLNQFLPFARTASGALEKDICVKHQHLSYHHPRSAWFADHSEETCCAMCCCTFATGRNPDSDHHRCCGVLEVIGDVGDVNLPADVPGELRVA